MSILEKYNPAERIKMIKAMEYIARQINDEDVFEGWLMYGVADGDIRYGDLDGSDIENTLEYYISEDSDFADIMDTFLRKMSQAYKSGGLYCNGVVSEAKKYD